MRFICVSFCVILSAAAAQGFSVGDHQTITELAFAELNECGMLPAALHRNTDNGEHARDVVVGYNLREDNYLVNGIKKLFVYSHFYNPMRPLRPEWQGRQNAAYAVIDYSAHLARRYNRDSGNPASDAVLQDLGKIVHLVQDASSAPHVLWVNHGLADGFENRVNIKKSDLEESKFSCADISVAGLKSPLEIMKAAGVATMKELQELVEFEEIQPDGSEPKVTLAPWSQTYFSNDAVYTQKVSDYLRNYNYFKPDLNSPTTDDNGNEGWDQKLLGRGEYGPFSDGIPNILIRGDNFGRSGVIDVKGKKIRVENEQFKKLKKVLMRQAVLSTQRVLLLLNE